MKTILTIATFLQFFGCTGKVHVEINGSLLSNIKIEQLQGSLTDPNKINIYGDRLNYLNSVSISNQSCVITSQSSSQVQCEITTNLAPGYYNIVLKDKNQKETVITNGYASGAVVVGQPDLVTLEGVDRYSTRPFGMMFSGNSLYAADTLHGRLVSWDLVTREPISAFINRSDFSWFSRWLVTRNSSDFYQSTVINDFCQYGSKFVTLESAAGRIIVYNSFPSTYLNLPDYVLGQPSFSDHSHSWGIIDVDRLYAPQAIACDANNIIVSDGSNHRVLIWNRPITSNFQAPDVVLGQADMVSVSANRGAIASPTASTLYNPRDVEYDGSRLFVTDAGNHRVLIWNSLPTSNGQAADLVLGQALFTTRTSGASSSKFNSPNGIAIDNNNLYIADSVNNRVLLWSLSTPISSWSNGRAADLVLGQTNLTNNSANRGGVVDLGTFANPIRVITNNTQLAVSDYNNRRMLIWSTLPTVNGQSADFQLGQISNSERDSVTSTETMISDYKIPFPRSAFLSPSGKLYITSSLAHRTLLFNSIDKNYPQASIVLGQADFFSTELPLTSTSSSLTNIDAVFVDSIDQKLFISDAHRILIWDSEPTTNNQAANLVLGQSNLTTNSTGITNSKFNNARGVCRTNDKLFVVDAGNNRILRFTYPLSTGMAADLVLGQANFTSNTANGGLGFLTTQAQGLFSPYYIYCDNNYLIVSDSSNNRVLIWNSLPTVNNQAPDVVLGQPDFTTRIENNGGISSRSLSAPRGVASDGTRLFVSEFTNNRILIWNKIPTSNFAPADSVMGQDFFTTNTVDCKSVDSTKITHKCFNPGSIQYIGNNRLLINDYALARILILPIP